MKIMNISDEFYKKLAFLRKVISVTRYKLSDTERYLVKNAKSTEENLIEIIELTNKILIKRKTPFNKESMNSHFVLFCVQ